VFIYKVYSAKLLKSTSNVQSSGNRETQSYLSNIYLGYNCCWRWSTPPIRHVRSLTGAPLGIIPLPVPRAWPPEAAAAGHPSGEACPLLAAETTQGLIGYFAAIQVDRGNQHRSWRYWDQTMSGTNRLPHLC